MSGGGDELGAAFEEAVVLGGELEVGVGVQGAAQQLEQGADLVGGGRCVGLFAVGVEDVPVEGLAGRAGLGAELVDGVSAELGGGA
jgi:hypothetical protein